MKTVPTPQLSLSLLHPKYWGVWFAFGLLAFIVNILPYSVLRGLGHGIGVLVMKLLKKRRKVAEKNLQLCFPALTSEERDLLVERNFKNTGMALIETGMAWFWPKWRVARISQAVGKERMLAQEEQGRGVLVLCSHHLNLEMTARIFSQFAKGYGVYRPHSNAAYEFIQHRGRTRFGHQMIDRKDVKSMLKVLKKGQRLWYLPDHDYGSHNSVFAPFFNMDSAAATAGSSVLIDASKCAVISGVSVFEQGLYTLYIGQDLSGEVEKRNPEQAARVLNAELERMIKRDVSAWMWLHKRFKTRPEGEMCVYS